jgi:hypothetical protein
MTSKKFLLTVFILAIFAVVGSLPLEGRQGMVFKKDITVASGEVQDNVITFGGNVVVDGTVEGIVVSLGGSITIGGEVGEAVVGIGSRITLKSAAVVKGDVVSIGGSLDKEPGCTINGDTVYLVPSEIGSKLFKEGFFGGLFSLSLIPFLLVLKLIGFFIWLILAMAASAIMPRQIAFASGQVRKSFWPVFGLGILALIVFTGTIIFAALLSIILIGIPILFALVAAGIAIKIFGRVVLFYFFGESLLRAFGSKNVSTVGAVLLGLVLVTLLSMIPVLGFLFTFCLSIIGWGVTIKTKFGTAESWHPKK